MNWKILVFSLLYINSLFAQDSTVVSKPLKAFIAPTALVLSGFAIKQGVPFSKYDARDWRNRHFPSFSTHLDDVIVFVPGASAYALDWLGLKAKHGFWERSLIGARAAVFTGTLVYSGKYFFDEIRPNGEKYAFPSGHSAIAFMGAHFLHKELGHHSRWISVGGYAIASATAGMRVLNNEHWLSDVLVGAGIGLLGTELSYRIHQRKKKTPKRL
jgi:membrane-associated phospholipid phosphatase